MPWSSRQIPQVLGPSLKLIHPPQLDSQIGQDEACYDPFPGSPCFPMFAYETQHLQLQKLNFPKLVENIFGWFSSVELHKTQRSFNALMFF